MAANSFNFDVNLKLNAETKVAKAQIEGLQQQLQKISDFKVNFSGINALTSEINEASSAAMKLQANLKAALNPDTGTLDFSKFNTSIQRSGNSVTKLASSLLSAGADGQQAFMSLADAISRSDIPLARTSKLVSGLWDNLKKTAGWQISSSVIHGIMGQYQQAMGYAKALDKSLTDIRIVTGQSADEMARFAKEANAAAKKLSTTTTDYTNASLIYYQQGLSDSEVKKRSDITIKMANATGTSAEKVSDQLTSIWNNFDNGTKSLEHYADVMTALGAATASSTDEIAKGIQKFAAISDTVGLSYEYAASALATITATTRESADTVGNSLKTLFSRIQGLQLGETLDDGTTLNKYSTALAKVGISIKDASGNLRDMNSILDDMGSKWHTLAEDQQMALAQTVGGVRQYTQIMTLMENWDFFKENLNTAETATGTLQAQADIFADSWEAAQNRMRASWEGLWDSLIDSDGFKQLLNIGSTLVEGLTTFVDSIGGATGVLSSSLGLVGTVFKSEIASSLTDAAFSVKQIFGGRNREIEARQNTLNEMAGVLEHGLFDNLGSTERATRVAVLRQQAEESVARAERRKFMTEDEKLIDIELEKNLSLTREALIQNAKEIDDLKVRKESITEETGDAMFFTRVIETEENKDYYAKKKAFEDSNARIGEIESELNKAKVGSLRPDGSGVYRQRDIDALKRELKQVEAERDRAKEEYKAATGVTGETFTRNIAQEQMRYQKEMNEIRQAVQAGKFVTRDKDGRVIDERDYDVQAAQKDIVSNDKKLWDKILRIDTNNTEQVAKLTEAQKQFLDSEKKAQAELITALENVTDSQEAKDSGISDKAEQQANILRDYNLQRDQRMVEAMLLQLEGKDSAAAQQYRERIQAERLELEKRGQRGQLTQTEQDLLKEQQKTTKRMNVAEGITSGLTGIASMQGAKESLKAMQQAETTGEKILGAVGTGMNAMNAYSNFNQAFQAFGASSQMAGVLSASLMAFDFAASAASEQLSKSYNALKIIAQQSAESAAQLQAAYATNQNNHAILLNNIEAYNKATQLLNDLGMSSKERAESEYDQNQIASKLISDYNLNDDEFYRVGNRIEITQAGLDRITEESEQNVSASKYAADEATVDAKQASTDYQAQTLERSLINQEKGYDKEQRGNNIAATGKGAQWAGIALGIGGIITGAIASATGVGAAAGIPLMIASAAAIAGGIAAEKVGSDMANDARAGQENSFIDRALELTKETGSTAWMDEENVEGFNTEQLQLLRDNRHRLEDLKNTQEATEKQGELVEENIARNLVVDHEATRDFEQADKIADGVVDAYRKGKEDAEQSEDITGFESKDAQSKYTIADELRKQLGLDGLNQLTWTQDDTANKQLRYTYMDEKGVKQEGYINYDAIMDAKIAKEGQAVGNNYISTMTSLYDAMESTLTKDEASGILSLLTGGDFESATQAEINAVQTLFDGIDFSALNSANLAEKLGITEQQLQTYADTLGITVDDIIDTFEIYTDKEYVSPAQKAMEKFTLDDNYADWFAGEGQQIFESMTQSTMRTFYGKLTEITGAGGEKAGKAFLNNLSSTLKDSGISEKDYDQVLESLMALDWSDWNVDTSAIEIIESLGGIVDKTSESFAALMSIMKTTSMSIPDFSTAIDQLSQLSGAIQNIKIGNTLSEADLQNFKDAGYDLSKYTMKQWDGSYTLINDPETIKEDIQEDLLNTFDQSQRYADIHEKYIGEDSQYRITLGEIRDLTLEDLARQYSARPGTNGEIYYEANGKIGNYAEALGIEGEQVYQTMADMGAAQEIIDKYIVNADGKITGLRGVNGAADTYFYDEQGNLKSEFSASTIAGYQSEYDSNMLMFNTAKAQGEALLAQMEQQAGADWSTLTTEQRQQIASTYDTLDKFEASKNDGRGIIYDENGDLTEAGQDQLKNLALQYPELTEYVEAYNNALASKNETAIESAETAMKEAIAMQEALATYTALTGKKIDLAKLQDTMDKLREDMGADGVEYSGTEEELADLAAQVLAAADAYGQLSKNSAEWIANLGEDSYKAKEAAQNLGKYLEIVLGLNDLEGITPTDWIEVIETAEEKLKDVGGLSAVIRGDRRAGLEFGELLARRANGGTLEQAIKQQKEANGGTSKLEEAIDTMQSWFVDNGIEGFSDLGGLSEEQQAAFKKNNEEIWNESGGNWETYQAAAEAAGYTVSRDDFLKGGTYTSEGKTYYTQYEYKNLGNGNSGWVNTSTNEVLNDTQVSDAGLGDPMAEGQGNADVNSAGQYYRRTGGGGGGGGGPTKVQVKSAQELMTRYKVIDQKTTINDMQKTAALQAKDLLYGQSKINQLNTINTLLRKQQQLTTDRITEELDYLEKDKKKIEELIERYNKDAEDEDKINLEYDGFGIITNYKQVIGKWAEELASYYADGELTAEEGKKAEELQKKIQDFTTLIKDYEDSLNQLMTSIETFENTLYELFSNQMEALTYKVQYKIEIEQDDLSYIDFYSSSIKDSYSMMYTYLELVGSKINEMSGQMAIYQSGYEDLIAFADSDPMQLWATQGVEGILTAEQIETARSYRDSMIDLYQSAVAARKEIEEQVLRTFDKWNDKINKNITDISRFTDMLAQFKDIINIVGKETLGLSDAFMKTFEQNSINQSMDNIAASRSQYENLAKTYEQSQSKLLEAQQRLEAAKASGDEGVIATAERDVEYWESIANKTQEEMQSAEDTMLTTLNHTLTMISEQFLNAITQAVDDFNDSIYQFNGLDGLMADYEQIREQQDLMVADYEKIYSLNKLNRDLEKTLDNSKLTAGRAKLLEIQKEIHDLNKSNVELSRYDLEYLQAKYDLKVAEMELDNARNTKDTVMLSKDSEGNWSYIYSQNTNVVEEAEQKVEDSLFRMQQLSQQYTEEMSAAMMSISQQMRDELAALSIQDFESEEAYYEERKRIQEKYSAQLAHREEELNKAIANNAALYDEDWANYSEMTGYKMSADQDWVDSFSETTLGGLIGSTSDISDYSILIADSTNKMNEALSAAASTYFVNADKALKTYGSSLKTFGSTVTTTTNGIISSSEKAVKEVSTMGATLVTEFEKITDKVEEDLAKWAEDIGNTLTALLEQIEAINKKIAESASKSIPETTEMIGQEEAAELLSKETFNNAEYAGWEFDGTRAVHNGMDIVQFNGELVKDVNEALQAYANAKIGSPAREEAAKKLEEVIADYWKFKKILERIYDPTNIDIEEIETPDITEMASGGYTGEWGNEGKYAVLHEKELVLNKDDTSNFLEALTVSKQLMELIELNARASSQGLGEMHAATIQDPLQNFEQQIQITAEFPDATDHNEIEQAFDNLINMASQYAHRYK